MGPYRFEGFRGGLGTVADVSTPTREVIRTSIANLLPYRGLGGKLARLLARELSSSDDEGDGVGV